jgi:CTP:molybdopterin cytidylyltransferase MocA
LKIGAVVLAGGNVPEKLKPFCKYRALLKLNDRYVLDYLTDTLSKSQYIKTCAYVTPIESHNNLSHLQGKLIPAGNSIMDNIFAGFDALKDDNFDFIILITGDLPLLTVDGLNNFISDSISSGGEITYPIIPKNVCDKRFPGGKRTYVKIIDGIFTGGNAFLMKSDIIKDRANLIQKLFNARKNPATLAKILGFSTIVKMPLGKLTIKGLEDVASKAIGAPVKAVISNDAGLGFDIDKPEDIETALKEVSRK